MKSIIYFIFLYMVSDIAAAQNGIGVFSNHIDIGNPKIKGDATYVPSTQVYTLSGGGNKVGDGRDEIHYVFKKIKGDFILTACLKLTGNSAEPNRKVGWMIRQTLEDDSQRISATLHSDGLAALQWRDLGGENMSNSDEDFRFAKSNPQVLQLERAGNIYIMRAAHFGEPLQVVGSKKIEALSDEVYVGLFVSANNETAVEEAIAWNVRIDKPVADNYITSNGPLGSRLEIINVFDGKRKVIHEFTGAFEAPNWMPDGKKLLFNQGGLLYTIPVEGGTPEKLNTDFATRNNNDHVISFDGKMLGISHHRSDMPGGGSTVYVLPLAGGTPKLVTEQTPSYLHGWNPNGKEVVYVAQRGNPYYDIYKKSIYDGQEVKLTNNSNYHVDGCEYSPDGKFIYFNSSESGTMQLWRMKPDGSDKEQLTFDEFNDWFPHISPDGKWIAFISFPSTINPDDHPNYKRVMLRLMPVNGGAPKVIAYLYGGQGTINVPSWSPDSKSIAFVSNSEKAEK